MNSTPDTIYKIVTKPQWDRAVQDGIFRGAPVDISDGYIHFSTSDQVRETARKHFKGQADLLLVSVRSTALGDQLRYEPSRNNQLFPHLYGDLDLGAVIEVVPLTATAEGTHTFPDKL